MSCLTEAIPRVCSVMLTAAWESLLILVFLFNFSQDPLVAIEATNDRLVLVW